MKSAIRSFQDTQYTNVFQNWAQTIFLSLKTKRGESIPVESLDLQNNFTHFTNRCCLIVLLKLTLPLIFTLTKFKFQNIHDTTSKSDAPAPLNFQTLNAGELSRLAYFYYVDAYLMAFYHRL